MRILQITSYQGPEVIAQRRIVRNRHLGGSRKVELISRMLLDAGHENVILSAGIPAERSGRFHRGFEGRAGGRPAGARVIYADGLDVRIANQVVAGFSSLRRISREERTNGRFDVLWPVNIDEYTMLIVRWYLAKYGPTPIILEYEDAVDTTGRGTGRMRMRIWKALERWLAPRLSGVVAVNTELVERLGHPNSMLLRGVVSDSLRARSSQRLAPFSGSPPYLAVYTGSLTPEKGVARILAVARRFEDRVRFVICGGGTGEEELRELAARTGSPVEFRGYLPEAEMEAMLTSADLLLNPHDDEDSGGILPFKLVEYLAAGGAVVTTRAGVRSNDEVFNHCEMAEPNAFADGIERVLGHREAAAVRAARGREWAIGQYSQEAAGRLLDAVVRRAAEAPCTY